MWIEQFCLTAVAAPASQGDIFCVIALRNHLCEGFGACRIHAAKRNIAMHDDQRLSRPLYGLKSKGRSRKGALAAENAILLTQENALVGCIGRQRHSGIRGSPGASGVRQNVHLDVDRAFMFKQPSHSTRKAPSAAGIGRGFGIEQRRCYGEVAPRRRSGRCAAPDPL